MENPAPGKNKEHKKVYLNTNIKMLKNKSHEKDN